MQFEIDAKKFREVLRTAAAIAPGRSTIPAWSYVKIQAVAGMVVFTATGWDCTLVTKVHVGGDLAIKDEGAVCIRARLLSDMAGTFTGRVTVASRKPSGVMLSGGEGDSRSVTIAGMDPKEYPEGPETSTKKHHPLFRVSGADFRTALSRAQVAVAVDDTRPVLTSILFVGKDGGEEMTLASADGFRLTRGTLPAVCAFSGRLPIPARPLSHVARLLDPDADVEAFTLGDVSPLSVPEHQADKSKWPGPDQPNLNAIQIGFWLGDSMLYVTSVAAGFPDVDEIIKGAKGSASVEFDVHRMREAVRAASIMARDGAGILRLEGRPGTVVLFAKGDDLDELIEEVPVTYTLGVPDVNGVVFRIAFNYRYTDEALRAMQTERVTLEVASPSSPGVFRPVGSSSFLHVVMPMFVTWPEEKQGRKREPVGAK